MLYINVHVEPLLLYLSDNSLINVTLDLRTCST